MVAAPIVASASILAVGAVPDVDPIRTALVGEAALAFTATVPAFIADDATALAAPGTPVEAPVRLLIRAALIAPVAIVGWLVVLALYNAITPEQSTDLSGRVLAALALATGALACAAAAGRSPSVASPGAAGVAAMAIIGLALSSLPTRWMARLPSADLVWVVTILGSLIVIGTVTKEPRSS